MIEYLFRRLPIGPGTLLLIAFQCYAHYAGTWVMTRGQTSLLLSMVLVYGTIRKLADGVPRRLLIVTVGVLMIAFLVHGWLYLSLLLACGQLVLILTAILFDALFRNSFDYIVRRLMVGSLTLLFITFVVYGLIRAMPGDPAVAQVAEMDPSKKMDPADFERIRKTYGLDKPWHQGYLVWLGNTLQLNLDRSFTHKKPVLALLKERAGPTLLLSVTSLMLAYVLAGPLGLYSVFRANRLDERIISVLLYMLYSLPSFVVAMFLLYIFYQRLDWLPLRGIVSQQYETLSFWGKTGDICYHMVLPVACYTYGGLAYYARFIRANMQEVVRQDYIRTARAKGVHPLKVIVVHAFRNTMIPMVTQLGLTLPALLSGSVILEQIFTWPGMGRLFFESILNRDYPVIMGLTLIFSVLTLAGQLLADVLYAIVDPRVSYS